MVDVCLMSGLCATQKNILFALVPLQTVSPDFQTHICVNLCHLFWNSSVADFASVWLIMNDVTDRTMTDVHLR
jgi:hypothetical protein